MASSHPILSSSSSFSFFFISLSSTEVYYANITKRNNKTQCRCSLAGHNITYICPNQKRKKKGEKPSNCQSMPGHNSHVGSETSGILDSLAGWFYYRGCPPTEIWNGIQRENVGGSNRNMQEGQTTNSWNQKTFDCLQVILVLSI